MFTAVCDLEEETTSRPAASMLYFTVNNVEAIYGRAKKLDCLSKENPHGPAGEICVRPWGERSFDALDRWQNPLCFVEAGTLYLG